MANTSTGENPFPIARTALEGAFGILRILARKGLLENGDLGELRAAFSVDFANLDPADARALNHHVETRFAEVRELAAKAARR